MPNHLANHFQKSMSALQDRYCRGVSRALVLALVSTAFLCAASFLQYVLAGERAAADPAAATELLQQTRDNREVLSETFPGFRSRLTVSVDGKVHYGTCSFRLPGRLQVTMQGTEDLPDVTATIRSMLMHRVPSTRMSAQDASFGAADEHPLGRELLLSDSYGSVYRIRDRQITQVDRRLADTRFVLTVLETHTTASGRYLPRHVFAVRLDPDTGSLLEAWAYVSEYQRVGGEYLPKSRQVIRTDQGRTSTLLIEWSDIELLEPESEG